MTNEAFTVNSNFVKIEFTRAVANGDSVHVGVTALDAPI